MKLPVLEADKANHVVYGAGICGLAASMAAAVSAPPLVAAAAGIAVAAVVAVWKERRDARTDGATSDHRDIVATVAGALPVALPLVLQGVL